MRKKTCLASFRDILSQFLTPQAWRQVHQAFNPQQAPRRWTKVLATATYASKTTEDK